MTDTDTLDTEIETPAGEPAAEAPPGGAGAGSTPGVGRALDGEAFWSGLKDGALILVAVFLGVVGIGYKAHQSSAGAGAVSLEALAEGRLPPDLADLARRRVILDLPKRYY